MTKTLYPLVAGAVPTRILNDFVFSSTARIVVENTTYIPEAPNIITIRDNSDMFITVIYNTQSGNILTDLEYDSGDINHVFSAGSNIARCYTTYDHEALIEFTETKETSIPGSSLVPDTKVDAYDTHLIDTSNPHATTKAQVGLSNVDNTSDAEKVNTSGNPIKVALATKVDKISGSSLVPDTKVSAYDAHIVNKSNPHEVTKAQVGLPNVVDGAQINVIESIKKNGVAQTVTGKSVNLVLTKADVGLPNVADGAQVNVIESISKNGAAQTIVNKNVNLVLSKSDVGLSNVNNTSDANKPVSTATQTELDKKVNKVAGSSLVPDTKVTAYDSHLTNTGNPHSVTKSQVGLGNVDNTSDTTKADTAGNPVHDKIETKAPISHASTATTYGIASASNYGHPKAASAAPSNATLAAAVGTDNGLYARADHSHAKETFTMNGVTINSREWVSDNTYSDYPYKATISNTSISASHVPIVILSSDDAISGNICTVANTAEGNVTIYARAALPCVISKIAFIKE